MPCLTVLEPDSLEVERDQMGPGLAIGLPPCHRRSLRYQQYMSVALTGVEHDFLAMSVALTGVEHDFLAVPGLFLAQLLKKAQN